MAMLVHQAIILVIRKKSILRKSIPLLYQIKYSMQVCDSASLVKIKHYKQLQILYQLEHQIS